MTTGRCLQILRPLRRRDDDRNGAVGLLAAVEQPQRFGDPPRILVVINGYRLLIEVSLRVLGGVFAVGHRYRTEVLAGRPRQVHVSFRDHRDLSRRCRQAVRIRERVVHARGVGILHQAQLHLPEPRARAFIERPVCDNAIRDTGGHRNGRLLDRGAGGAAAVMDLGEELQVTDAGGARDGDLGVRVHRERDHAVDIGRGQPRIVERVEHRLGRQPKLAAAGVLREVGGSDADDRRLA